MRATLCRVVLCLALAWAIQQFDRAAPVGGRGVAYAEASPAKSTPSVQVADIAEEQIGAPYVWGGMSPYGFDCTGFVTWVFGQLGLDLPRTEAGQLASGPLVGMDDLQSGDIVVFADTYRRGLSHTGVYVGGGQFVHAVDERHGVAVSSVWDAYWAQRFVGASRPLADV